MKKYDIRVASSGITFIPNFAKISPLVQKLKVGHRWNGDLISLLCYLKDEGRLKMGQIKKKFEENISLN
jgi:hypothetical protein